MSLNQDLLNYIYSLEAVQGAAEAVRIQSEKLNLNPAAKHALCHLEHCLKASHIDATKRASILEYI